MKALVQVASVALALTSAAAFSQQQGDQQQALESADTYVTVAQATQGAERAPMQAEQQPTAKPRKLSMHELSGLAADGSFPSRGGPLDD